MHSSHSLEVMTMKNNVKHMLKKELKEMFRDKKSLSMMLIIPIMIPLLIIGMSALFEMQTNKPQEDYNKVGFAYKLSDAEKTILENVGIDYEENTVEKLEEGVQNGDVNMYVTKEDVNYTFHSRRDDKSSYTDRLVSTYFESYKQYLQTAYLNNHDMPAEDILNIITYGYAPTDDDDGTSEYFANYITTYAFLFIIMAITVSATYPATDATAGEKERGTLETLLTFPIKSKDIILGKFLSVSISSIITGLLSLILMVTSLVIANGMFTIYEEVSLMPSFTSLAFAVVVIIAYSCLISGLCISIASKAKTFKEAQSALTPLTFISFFPSMIAFMIEIKSSALLSMVPFLNFTLLFTDITNGEVDILNIVLMIASTIIFIAIMLSMIIKQYKSENVLFTN